MTGEANAQARWRKSATSGSTDCVETAVDGTSILMRDSKDPTGPVLRFTRGEWEAFIAGVHAGAFDF